VARARLSFGLLYDRHHGAILRYCYYRLGDWEDAADVTQQVFTNALTHFGHFEDRDDSARAWLFTIANRETNRRRARRGRDAAPLLEEARLVDPALTPEEAAIAADDHARLHALMAQLPDRLRSVCELRLAGLSTAEIATMLDISQGAVRTAHSRAVDQLQRLMAGQRETGGRRG
jgi:RNA polymerase sigma-70 factor (ECF subfamily)